jgi:hypothetical protein
MCFFTFRPLFHINCVCKCFEKKTYFQSGIAESMVVSSHLWSKLVKRYSQKSVFFEVFFGAASWPPPGATFRSHLRALWDPLGGPGVPLGHLWRRFGSLWASSAPFGMIVGPMGTRTAPNGYSGVPWWCLWRAFYEYLMVFARIC